MKVFDFLDDCGVYLIPLAIIVVFAALFYAMYREEAKWEVFKKEHACKVVARVDGDVFNTYGVSSSGNMTVGLGTTPDKTGWLCDDGITYYK